MVIVVTILMMIVNVQDQSCQTQQKSAEFQQVTKRDKLIHHTDHLPSVTMTVGAKIRSKPPTVFRYILRALVYHICQGLSNLRNVKKALDISMQMAYNKREEGMPVDGLLPSVRLRNNRSSLQLGAVISVCYGKYRRSTQRLSRWGCCTESSLTKLHIPSQSLPFRERGFDRLPFSGMPSEL